MDPRQPELALPRVKELVEQYEKVTKSIRKETISKQLSALEREGVLVVQELCLTAPRLHDMLMQVSRNRRSELSRSPVEPVAKEEPVAEKPKKTPKKEGKKK